MSSPRVSIIMPARNAEKTISCAIASIREQTMRDWELIVVDDASTDRTAAIVAALQDPRILLLRSERNIRFAAARNLGLQHAGGKWAAFLDADDEWAPQRLERLLEAVHECAYCYVTDLEVLAVPGPTGRLVRAAAPRLIEDGSVAEMDLNAALRLGHDVRPMIPVTAFRRPGIEFPEWGSCGEWTFLSVRLSAQGIRGRLVRRVGYLYRAHAAHDSSTLQGKEELVKVCEMLGSDSSLSEANRRLLRERAKYARQGLVTAALRKRDIAMAFRYVRLYPATLRSVPRRALFFLFANARVLWARTIVSLKNVAPESTD